MRRRKRHEVIDASDIEQAKLLLGFGDVNGFAKPCGICTSKLSRTYSGRTRCWDHYDGPLQLELPAGRHLVRKGRG